MMLKEQKIESNSVNAIVFRNINRPLVDIIFEKKSREKNKKRKREFDYQARQLWREIIINSNTL